MEFFAEKNNPGATGRFIDIDSLSAIKEGVNIYTPKPHVEIRVNGISDIFVGPATELHKTRFPEAWAAYLESKKAPEVKEVAIQETVRKPRKAKAE